jgi:hypothetical protein
MDIAYDWEFLENGVTIRPISIGMVKEDGEEYYAVVNEGMTLVHAVQHPWLRANVIPYLPVEIDDDTGMPSWDSGHPDYKFVKAKEVIAWEVKNFILSVPNPSLWAYFASYDHVCLAQLWGVMINMPKGVPQRTNDIAQDMERLGIRAPSMPGIQQHNALSDAREVMYKRKWLKEYEKTMADRKN